MTDTFLLNSVTIYILHWVLIFKNWSCIRRISSNSFKISKLIMIDGSPIPDANPQVAEETGPSMAAVSFAGPFVPPKLLQLAQAVREQHVRQLLPFKTGQVTRLFQLHLQTGGTAGGGRRAAFRPLLTGPSHRWHRMWFTSGTEGDREKNTCMVPVNTNFLLDKS